MNPAAPQLVQGICALESPETSDTPRPWLALFPAQCAGCCEFLQALRQAGALRFWSEVPALQALPWKELQGRSFLFGFGPRMLEIRQRIAHCCQRALYRLSP